jgi:hypothetical protein
VEQVAEASDSQASEPTTHHVAAASGKTDAWVEKLKGQTIVEDAIEGNPDRAAKVSRQHERLMSKMGHQMQADLKLTESHGAYDTMTMLHQYGAGKQDYLLASDSEVEPVSGQAGLCPAGVPEKHYDISAIDVEITLNRWADYYVGYMYVLTENLDKVRDEEAANAAAREKEGYDPGAVATGLQNNWIQPLVIRGNQGDCVKFTLRNQLMGGEGVSMQIPVREFRAAIRTKATISTGSASRNSVSGGRLKRCTTTPWATREQPADSIMAMPTVRAVAAASRARTS